MRKLEDIAQAEEKKLELAEQYLEEDAALFDEFLKENDRNASEAIKVYASSSLLFCLVSSLAYSSERCRAQAVSHHISSRVPEGRVQLVVEWSEIFLSCSN